MRYYDHPHPVVSRMYASWEMEKEAAAAASLPAPSFGYHLRSMAGSVGKKLRRTGMFEDGFASARKGGSERARELISARMAKAGKSADDIKKYWSTSNVGGSLKELNMQSRMSGMAEAAHERKLGRRAIGAGATIVGGGGLTAAALLRKRNRNKNPYGQ